MLRDTQATQWDQVRRWAACPAPPEACLGLCAPGTPSQAREQGRSMEGSSELDCEWLRRPEVAKMKGRNDQITLPASGRCGFKLMFRNQLA